MHQTLIAMQKPRLTHREAIDERLARTQIFEGQNEVKRAQAFEEGGRKCDMRGLRRGIESSGQDDDWAPDRWIS
jgi:hypothetical protein